MLDQCQHDSAIRQLYTGGTPSLEIARMLALDLMDVVLRVKAMELQPPGMGVRRARTSSDGVPLRPCSADPAPLPVAVAATVAETARPEPAPVAVQTLPRRPLGPVSAARPAAPARQPEALPPPLAVPPRAGAAVLAVRVDEEEDDEDNGRFPGRPRGWLMSETEVETLFARAGQRFQDVQLRRRA